MALKMKKMIKNRILPKIIKLLLSLDNRIYRRVSKYAVLREGGLHPKHRLMKYHDFFIKNTDSDDIVLDIGCGNGYNTYQIAGKAKSVVGIDIDKNNIETAKRDFKRSNIEYIAGDATIYKFNKKFDVIVLSNVLEHIEDRIGFLKKIKNLGRKILIRVPMMNRSWMVLYKKELGVEYKLDDTHCIEYTTESFLDELRESGIDNLTYTIKFGEIWAVVKY